MNTFILSQKQGHKFETAVGRNGGTKEDIEWLSNKENFRQVIRLARGEKASGLQTLIRVDRTVPPTYPSFTKRVLHPEFEKQGPAEYELSSIEQWTLSGQSLRGRVPAYDIYDQLKNENLLRVCLTLRDSEEIKKNGLAAYRRVFGEKTLVMWGSIVEHVSGSLCVACLNPNTDWSDEAGMVWVRLEREFSSLDFAGLHTV